MKRQLIILFLFCLPFFSASQSNIDVLHYKYEIGLNDNNDTIYGKAEITFATNYYFHSTICELKKKNSSGKGMKLDSIFLQKEDSKKNLIPLSVNPGEGNQIKYEDDKIILMHNGDSPGANSSNTNTFRVIIYYHGIPSDGLIISKNKYGHRTFFADNWPNRAHNWIPCHDDPADKASVEFIITAPGNYQVVANGIQIAERSTTKGFKETHWKEDVPISTKVMTVGVADFAAALVGNLNDCIPIYSWTYPEDRDKGVYDFAITKDILEFYSKMIGPYGFKKLANVQSKTIFGGLENANTIFYKEDAVTGGRKYESLYAHEIAHQWFGNMATEKSFAHLWLSEGFATYFTTLYFENKYGKDTAAKMRKEDREQVIAFSKTDKTPVVNEKETNYMELLNENNYQKGGWVLHMLRNQLGDSVFWKAIRKYYASYAGSIAGTEDLQKIFEQVSGRDLKQFFKQWLFTPGQPELDIKWKYNVKKKTLDITIRQMQTVPFLFPLELIYGKEKATTLKKTLNISGANQSFSIPAVQKPSLIVFDPEINLLFKGSISEVK
jgi:aminopeptidase N